MFVLLIFSSDYGSDDKINICFSKFKQTSAELFQCQISPFFHRFFDRKNGSQRQRKNSASVSGIFRFQ